MFVRGLVATGVSLGAAVTYSQALGGAVTGPGAGPALSVHDLYEEPTTTATEPVPEPAPEPPAAEAAPASTLRARPRLTG